MAEVLTDYVPALGSPKKSVKKALKPLLVTIRNVAPLDTMVAAKVTRKTITIVTNLSPLYAFLRKSSYFRSETETSPFAVDLNRFHPGWLKVVGSLKGGLPFSSWYDLTGRPSGSSCPPEWV